MQVAPTRPLFVTRAKLVNKLTTRAKNFWGRYGTTPEHPSRTRARLATLRSLNWPDNYDELSSPEQTAVRATQDQKMTEYRLAVNSAAHAANEEAAATLALINAGPAGTTTNSTDTPVKATKPGTEASAANPIDLITPEGSPVAPKRRLRRSTLGPRCGGVFWAQQL